MKKISLLAFVLITSTALFAQNETTTTQTIRFGVKAGVNLSKLRPSDMPSGYDVSTNMKTSMGGGFFVNVDGYERTNLVQLYGGPPSAPLIVTHPVSQVVTAGSQPFSCSHCNSKAASSVMTPMVASV